MSLDVAILGDDGTPQVEVHIGVKIHLALMSHAGGSDCPLLLRMGDYYRDTDYSATELPQLLEELGRLREGVLGRVLGQDELNALVTQLAELAHTAVEKQTGLAVIAD